MESKAHERENLAVLTTVQALLGSISPDVSGVSIDVDGAHITVHFAVLRMTPALEEDIYDVRADIAGLYWPELVTVETEVAVMPARPNWIGLEHRMVFLAATDPQDDQNDEDDEAFDD